MQQGGSGIENRINTNKRPRNAATCRGRYEKQAKGEFLMSDMLAVEQETNNDVRQFLNKINELRNKAPKNEETKHEEHTPDNHEETDHHEAKQQEQAWRGNLRYLDTLNRLDEVLPRKLYERWEKEHTVNDEAVLRALCYFAGTGKNSQLGWCRVGRGTIDKRARLSKNTVKKCLDRLVNHFKLVERTEGYIPGSAERECNEYQLLFKPYNMK
ncbi:hypothetical protein HMPREF9550_00962 [Escherichia coli MS 187-1]|uniref:protein YffL n=1 Tax=Escherichia coli TaxID=562 RepID=UPI0001DC66F8|nr:protein YffL [Escherichia coli]EFK26897.1 hypothetical protein HMPREF9550_00962 [Escherichia coli MS 187-1]